VAASPRGPPHLRPRSGFGVRRLAQGGSAPGAGRLWATGSTSTGRARSFASGPCARWTGRRQRSRRRCKAASYAPTPAAVQRRCTGPPAGVSPIASAQPKAWEAEPVTKRSPNAEPLLPVPLNTIGLVLKAGGALSASRHLLPLGYPVKVAGTQRVNSRPNDPSLVSWRSGIAARSSCMRPWSCRATSSLRRGTTSLA